MRRAAIVVLLALSISGCAAAGAGLGGVVAGMAADTTLSAFQAKVAARLLWNAKRQEMVSGIVNIMAAEANRLAMNGQHDAAMKLYEKVIEMHDEQHPQFLVEKLLEKVKR